MNYWTNKEEMKKRIDMTAHNLMCYSANMLMTKAKEGFEKEFKTARENLNLLNNMYKGMNK